MRILGVDTAVRCTGVGVVEIVGHQINAVAHGCIRNAPKQTLSECLQYLFTELRDWIQLTKPDEVVVEGVFYCRNAKTAMSLGHARGAVIAACGDFSLPIHEYSPRRVKQAVCGFGGASKEQVTRMIVQLLGLAQSPAADAADALALAVCRWHAGRGIQAMDSRI